MKNRKYQQPETPLFCAFVCAYAGGLATRTEKEKI
jgi:hypothetical protein